MTKATLKVVLLTCALAAFASAQARDGIEGVPGVEVVSSDWKYDGYVPVETVKSSKSGVSLKVKRGTAYVFRYVMRLTFKNGGERAIKAVEWEQVFFERKTDRELKRYRLEVKRAVAPGATATLAEEVFIKPEESTRHFATGYMKVRVTRVEFEDGSAWEAGKKSDS